MRNRLGWRLRWAIAASCPEFGHPSVFADHVDASRWLSFTVTLRDPTLFRLIPAAQPRRSACRGAQRLQNLAFTGQFCELPNDVVFTVEYSVRSAQTAVYALLGLELAAPEVYKGQHAPRIV